MINKVKDFIFEAAELEMKARGFKKEATEEKNINL